MTGHLLVPSVSKNTHYGPCLELGPRMVNKTNISSESQEDTDKIQMSLKKIIENFSVRHEDSPRSQIYLCKVTCDVPRNKTCLLGTVICLKPCGHKLKRAIS